MLACVGVSALTPGVSALLVTSVRYIASAFIAISCLVLSYLVFLIPQMNCREEREGTCFACTTALSYLINNKYSVVLKDSFLKGAVQTGKMILDVFSAF